MRLDLDIYRQWETPRSVCGQLWSRGLPWLYTLEPARENPAIPGHPCIPAGRYKVILTKSPRLGYVCPEVLDVPGRTAIRWHIGNYPTDVEGCVALGEERGPDYVDRSRGAFQRLMDVLPHYDEIWVTYHDGPPLEEGKNDGEQRTADAGEGTAADSTNRAHV
jgi:hypothetical protein